MSKESFSVPNGQGARYDFQHALLILCKINAVAWSIPAEKIALHKTKISSDSNELIVIETDKRGKTRQRACT